MLCRAPGDQARGMSEDPNEDPNCKLSLCYQQLEHEGGAFWCRLPLGHAGDHEPPPHEQEQTKRNRAAPKRFNDEPYPVKRSRPSGANNACSAAVSGGSSSAKQCSPPTAAECSAPRRRFAGEVSEPIGYLTEKQLTYHRSDLEFSKLVELQAKLSDSMRATGWMVLPRGANGIETAHFLYICLDPEEVRRAADGTVRHPYFTSLPMAMQWKDQHGKSKAAALVDETPQRGLVLEACSAAVAAVVAVPQSTGRSTAACEACAGKHRAHTCGRAYRRERRVHEALQAGRESVAGHLGDVREDAGADGFEPSRPRWLVEGLSVEVQMDEEGLHSSRYAATILEVREDNGTVRVQFDAFDADSTGGGGGSEESSGDSARDSAPAPKLTEWVETRRLWPPPPPPPPDFFERLSVGDPLELSLDDGWWEVELQKSKPMPNGGVTYQVGSPLYQTTHREVTPDRLRPRWQFVRRSGHEYWVAEAPSGLVVWEDEAEPEGEQADACANAADTVAGADVASAANVASAAEAAASAVASAERPPPRHEPLLLPHGQLQMPRPPPHEWPMAAALTPDADADADEAADAALVADADDMSGDGGDDGGGGGGGGGGDDGTLAQRLASARREASNLRQQLEAMQCLAAEYHARALEVREAANKIFPLAHSAVVAAGGELLRPECFMRPVPPLPPLPKGTESPRREMFPDERPKGGSAQRREGGSPPRR